MELSAVIYISVGIIFIVFLLFGLFFYTISRKAKYAHINLPYKFRIFENSLDKANSLPPIRHLRKRKFYRTNFADTIELKRIKKPPLKKSKKQLISFPFRPLLNKRFSILNNEELFNSNDFIPSDSCGDFNFRTSSDNNQK